MDFESEEFFGGGIAPKHHPWKFWRKASPNSALLNHYFSDKTEQLNRIGNMLRNTKDSRQKIAQTKLITAGLMTEMLIKVSEVTSNSLLVKYEDIVADTSYKVQRVMNHFQLPFDKGISNFITQSASRSTTSHDAFPVFRKQSAVAVADKPFKFLTNEEVSKARDVLCEIGIDTNFATAPQYLKKSA